MEEAPQVQGEQQVNQSNPFDAYTADSFYPTSAEMMPTEGEEMDSDSSEPSFESSTSADTASTTQSDTAETSTDAPKAEASTPESDTFFEDLFADTESKPTDAESKPADSTSSVFDFKPFNEALGKEFSTPDAVIAEIKQLKQTTQEAKSKIDSLPEGLKYLAELAMNGGDWEKVQGYATADMDALTPEQYFEMGIRQHFPNTQEGEDRYENYKAHLGEEGIFLEGNKIKAQEIQERNQFLYNQNQQLIHQKQAYDTTLRSEVDGIKTIGGIEVTKAMRTAVYDQISKGSYLVRNPDGTPNFSKSVRERLVLDNLDTIFKEKLNQGKVQLMRKTLADTSNVSISRNAAPAPVVETKQTSGLEVWANTFR